MYKTGDTIYIQAFCWSETGEQDPGSLTALPDGFR